MAKAKGIGDQPIATIDSAIQAKFWAARTELNSQLIEREDEIDLLLTALIAGRHPLIVGPPGVAKTMLSKLVASVVTQTYFDVLLQKDLDREEVFGPLDLPSLTGSNGGQSKYIRLTAGYLPEAEIALLDEIWKAGPAVLNRFLRILNEGEFLNDGKWTKVPLLMAIAASNEYPADDKKDELGAIFDRFLLRKNVKPVSTEAGRQRLLWGDNSPKPIVTSIPAAEVLQARADAKGIPITDQAKKNFGRILHQLKQEGISPGDRRLVQSVGVIKAYAYMCGSDKVESDHLEVLAHTLWNDPIGQPDKVGEIVRKIANPQAAQIQQYLLEGQTLIENVAPNDLQAQITTTKKLQEILGKLKAMKDTDKKTVAIQYIEGEVTKIKAKALESMDVD